MENQNRMSPNEFKRRQNNQSQQNDENYKKSLELREREIALKEKELALREAGVSEKYNESKKVRIFLAIFFCFMILLNILSSTSMSN